MTTRWQVSAGGDIGARVAALRGRRADQPRELGQVPVNEVDYTSALILLVKNMLCITLHCQKGVHLILSSYQVSACGDIRARVAALRSRRAQRGKSQRAGAAPRHSPRSF